VSVTARIHHSVSEIAAGDWDRLAGGGNPFTAHTFLSLLEESGSVGGRSGWSPLPVVIEDEAGRPAAAMPAYLKAHSQGEYVFDHSWADAWQRAGGSYYPKLQISVPFTPATGPRLLLGSGRTSRPRCCAWPSGCAKATNCRPPTPRSSNRPSCRCSRRRAGCCGPTSSSIGKTGAMPRSMISWPRCRRASARTSARNGRRRQGVEIRALTGDALRPEHWDAFWQFYQDTGARKWGGPI
jgi:predicted N-acyltransferase